MAPKRPLDDSASSEPPVKKANRGFRVGPDNLPDGPWKRKATKIKKELIHKAKLKKSYARLRARELASHTSSIPLTDSPTEEAEGGPETEGDVGTQEDTGPEMHPDRQKALEEPDMNTFDSRPRNGRQRPRRMSKNEENDGREETSGETDVPSERNAQRRHQPIIFSRAARGIAKREAQLEAARERERQRNEALEKREHRRRAITKAQGGRGDRAGKRKLGRESNVLLDKVKRMVGES